MVQIELHNPCWIAGAADDPNDYCAHGNITMIIDGMSLSKDEEWTVSGAALFLLRSVFHNHSKADPLAESNLLIPCCAFTPYKETGERFSLLLMGCNHGVDPTVTHEGDRVVIEHAGESRSITLTEWSSAVLSFAQQILDFYGSCSPKSKIEDEHNKKGWAEFWREFHELSHRAGSIVNGT